MSVSRVSASRIDTGPVEGAVTALRLPHPSPFFASARLLLNTTIPAFPAWFLLLYATSTATHMRKGIVEFFIFVELLSQGIPIILVMRYWEIYFGDFHYMRFIVLASTVFLMGCSKTCFIKYNFTQYKFPKYSWCLRFLSASLWRVLNEIMYMVVYFSVGDYEFKFDIWNF